MYDHDFASNVNSATAQVGMWVILLERRCASSVSSGLWPNSIMHSSLSPSLRMTRSRSSASTAYSRSSTTNSLDLIVELLGDDLRCLKRAPSRTRQDQIGLHIALCQSLTHLSARRACRDRSMAGLCPASQRHPAST